MVGFIKKLFAPIIAFFGKGGLLVKYKAESKRVSTDVLKKLLQSKPSQYITLTKKESWWGVKDTSVYNQAFPEKIIFKVTG